MLSTPVLTVVLLALPAFTLSHSNPHNNARRGLSHQKRSTRPRAARRQTSDPSNLVTGSLTSAEGCTQFYQVQDGNVCLSISTQFGISLEEFYAMNPQVGVGEADCPELWTGWSYCVKRELGSKSGSSSASANAVAASADKPASKAVVAAAATTSAAAKKADNPPAPVTTTAASTKPAVVAAAAQKPTTTQAPAASSSSASNDDEGENDVDCDDNEDDDEQDAAPASSSKPVVAADAPKTTTTQAPAAAPSAKAQSSESSDDDSKGQTAQANVVGNAVSALKTMGISTFLGVNSGAIVSWFHTNAGTDSTNGHSWCGFPYNDNTPGFAPSLKTMLASAGGDYQKAATMFCGLEAEFTTPDGKKATLVIADAFDDTWVRTPASVDVVYNHFQDISGHTTDDKNDVVQGVSWQLTGNRNDQYKFNGAGN